MYQRKYAQADQLYRKLLVRLETNSPPNEIQLEQRKFILNRLGRVNTLYLRNDEQAIKDYSQLIGEFPTTNEALAAQLTIADLYLSRLEKVDEALDIYQNVVRAHPNHPETRDAQLHIAQIYFKRQNFPQVHTEIDALLRRWPRSEEAIQAEMILASSFILEDRFSEAIAIYERLLLNAEEGDSFKAIILFEIANCFQELENYDLALKNLYEALSNHSNPLLVQEAIRRVRNRKKLSQGTGKIITQRRFPPQRKKSTQNRSKATKTTKTTKTKTKTTKAAASKALTNSTAKSTSYPKTAKPSKPPTTTKKTKTKTKTSNDPQTTVTSTPPKNTLTVKNKSPKNVKSEDDGKKDEPSSN